MNILVIAIILGLVEGVTEYLPISSTGHLILVGHLLGYVGEAAATFEIFIQLGAILAVVVLYRQRFAGLLRWRERTGFNGLRGLLLLGVTILPALFAGALAHGFIKDRLFNPLTVAIGLGLGGLAIVLIEVRTLESTCDNLDSLTWQKALVIGCFQCLALWPGVSRSAATILGAMLIGVRRDVAAEYSFIVAVPTLIAATTFDLYQSIEVLSLADAPVFSVGFITAFLSALFAVRFFVRLLNTHTLAPFGWYRMALAALVILVFT